MLFNSYIYIFCFLPLAVVGYFLACRVGHRLGVAWLAASSVAFYGWWNPAYVPLLAVSVIVNHTAGRALSRRALAARDNRWPLTCAVAFNLLLLGVFKYADFATENLNRLLSLTLPEPGIVLPLAISFFTFQQVRYVAECARGTVREDDFTEYCLFVTFFPQLIAGPIVDHREMMPQFADPAGARPNWRNVAAGAQLFAVGLFKKAAVADTFAAWATLGFDHTPSPTMAEAWAAALSYTFQLYFDFSGYTDMATGSALMLNIRLPANFDSPYRALDIRDFWRRWHITLSRFLREYLYFPLGGSRGGEVRAARNVMITFLLGGLWHGAGWTFVAWGGLHGLGVVAHRMWERAGLRLPRALGWGVTFIFVCVCWVLFRAHSLADAWRIVTAMFSGPWTGLAPSVCRTDTGAEFVWLAIAAALGGCLLLPSSTRIPETYRPTAAALAIFATVWTVAFVNLSGYSEFIYFRF
ncbi:D-alanyl-lipoteichoic acid acyltransferase DltB (MBOAT superfamily) [Desulfobaculum xiamenense]|uniref:D-alanyl-lipoteichoic acid acyltransferase DltB (MBOAT superfamily) n=1 Tax=Desulfobaculum xiamenense TaxID=995050 RepID=A0A846QQ24_9BACT|nr:MBOAT family protein [Desulfobaculum xiamenense]NJB68433.1 D-alanyl-lipoteichoic acid acyltransferase DltB (MBOAT superfamily) [Desulfobaculum xiamenense]